MVAASLFVVQMSRHIPFGQRCRLELRIADGYGTEDAEVVGNLGEEFAHKGIGFGSLGLGFAL